MTNKNKEQFLAPFLGYKTVAILIDSLHRNLLQDSYYFEKNPLGGSETAGLKLHNTFKDLGFDVTIITNFDEIHSLQVDIFISIRNWQIFRAGVTPGKINLLWCQDDVDQPAVNGLSDPAIAQNTYKNIDGILVISHYQAKNWITHLHAPNDKIIHITNGINYNSFDVDPNTIKSRKRDVYYASTPYRGLEPLLNVWKMVAQNIPDAHLHIFSSMKIYDDEKNDYKYQELYEQSQNDATITYHGSVGQDELHKYAKQCRALAYPCIFPETSCIVAMEAMASGCAVVATSIGSLPETAWNNPLVETSGDWLTKWACNLIDLLIDDDYYYDIALQNINTAKYQYCKIL